MSLALIACVKWRHNLQPKKPDEERDGYFELRWTDWRDSLGSCSSSGATHLGEICCPSFTASNSTRLSPV